MDCAVGERVIVTSGPNKDLTGIVKKKGLQITIQFDDGGKEKSLPYLVVRRYVPPAQAAAKQAEDEEVDMSADGINPLELVIKELQKQVQQVTLHADRLDEDLQKEQATKAELERSLAEEGSKSQALAEALAQVQEEVRSHQAAADALTAEVDVLKTTLQEDRVEIDALSDALSRAQDECRGLKKLRKQLESEVEALADRAKADSTSPAQTLEAQEAVLELKRALEESSAAQDALKVELASLKDELAARIEEDDRTIKALRSELSTAEQATSLLREQLSLMTGDAATTEELDSLRAAIRSLEEELALAKQQASQAGAQSQEATEFRAAVSQLEGKLKAAEKEVELLREKDEVVLSARVETLEQEVRDTTQATAEALKKLSDKDEQLRALQAEKEEMSGMVEQLTAQVQTLQTEQSHNDAELSNGNDLQASLDGALQEIKRLEEAAEEARAEKEVLIQEIQESQQDLEALRARWSNVKSRMQEQEKGMNEDVETLRAELADARKRFEELEETLRVLEEEKAGNSGSLSRNSSDCDISSSSVRNGRRPSQTMLSQARAECAALQEQVQEREREVDEWKERTMSRLSTTGTILGGATTVLLTLFKDEKMLADNVEQLKADLKKVVKGWAVDAISDDDVKRLHELVVAHRQLQAKCKTAEAEAEQARTDSKKAKAEAQKAREEADKARDEVEGSKRECSRLSQKLAETRAPLVHHHDKAAFASPPERTSASPSTRSPATASHSDISTRNVDADMEVDASELPQELERLHHENARLRREIEDLQEQLSAPPPSSCLPFGSGKRKPKAGAQRR